MKVFMLDLSKCKEPQLDGCDKPIPCRIAEFGHNLEVIEDRIDPAVLAIWHKKGRERLGTKRLMVLDDAPLGFNLQTTPVGATITVIEEED